MDAKLKGYWFVAGGIMLGMGFKDAKGDTTKSAFEVIGGTLLIVGAIYLFKK